MPTAGLLPWQPGHPRFARKPAFDATKRNRDASRSQRHHTAAPLRSVDRIVSAFRITRGTQAWLSDHLRSQRTSKLPEAGVAFEHPERRLLQAFDSTSAEAIRDGC